MILFSKSIVILFGVFLIAAGFLMLFNPTLARSFLRKAGSNNLINYAEITIRIIPAVALILFAEFSRFPLPFMVFGWFMFCTSIILYLIPRKMHHQFSLKSADMLKPLYFQLISPFSILFGLTIIYGAT